MTLELRDRSDRGECFEILLSGLYHRLVRPGETMIDGGANGGLHTISMGRVVSPGGMVFGYEPLGVDSVVNWIAYEKLEACCRMSGAALGAEHSKRAYFVHKTNDALSSLQRMSDKPDEWIEREVEVVRLDDEPISSPCTFIKLDLEGGEYDALKGAVKLIAREKPLIAFECGLEWSAAKFGYTVEDYFDLFAGLGYELIDFLGRKVERDRFVSHYCAPEILAAHRDDPRRPLAIETIAEFNARAPLVAPAVDWSEGMARVAHPFELGFWKA